MKKLVCLLMMFSAGISLKAQDSKKVIIQEVLEYISASYDPVSGEIQLKFKNAGDEPRIFYYSKKDEVRLEEKFFNPPPVPFTESGKDLTKTELIGSKHSISYYSLSGHATSTCCFKMKACAGVPK